MKFNLKFLENKKKVCKSYSFWSIVGNFSMALSVSGLSVLGIISSKVALPVLLVSAVLLGLFGTVGRFIDQQLEESQKECNEDKKE